MGVTANKLIADIRNIVSSGPTSDDFRISDRQILYWVGEVRSTLISQAIQKKQDLSDIWIQRIKSADLSLVDISECPELPVDCTILRTDSIIPNTVEVDNNNLIISVTGLDGTPLTKLNYFRSRYKKYSKFTKSNKGWFLRNGYIYVINSNELKYITINGIFEDPSELETFYCSNEPCWTRDDEYPISMKMASMVTDIVVKTKALPFLQFPQDSKSDSANLEQMNKQ